MTPPLRVRVIGTAHDTQDGVGDADRALEEDSENEAEIERGSSDAGVDAGLTEPVCDRLTEAICDRLTESVCELLNPLDTSATEAVTVGEAAAEGTLALNESDCPTVLLLLCTTGLLLLLLLLREVT